MTGNLSLYATYTGLDELFLCTLGHEQWHSVVDLGNGFYQHIIEPDYDLYSHSYLAGDGLIAGDILAGEKKVRRFTLVIDKQVSQHQFPGCHVNNFTMSGNAGGAIQIDVGLICYEMNLQNIDSSTWNWVDGKCKKLLFPDLVMKIDGNEINISEFSLNINNNLTQSDDSNNIHPLEPMRPGKRNVSFSFKLPKYDTDEFLNKVDTDSDVSVSLEFTSSDGYEIGIYMPKARFNFDDVQAKSESLIQQDIELIPLGDGTIPAGFPSVPSGRKPEIYFKLVNKISTELWRI